MRGDSAALVVADAPGELERGDDGDSLVPGAQDIDSQFPSVGGGAADSREAVEIAKEDGSLTPTLGVEAAQDAEPEFDVADSLHDATARLPHQAPFRSVHHPAQSVRAPFQVDTAECDPGCDRGELAADTPGQSGGNQRVAHDAVEIQ